MRIIHYVISRNDVIEIRETMPSKVEKITCHKKDKVKKLKKGLPKASQLKKLADSYKALGHPGRLAILKVLELEEACVCDLSHTLGQPVSTVSQNLNILKKAGWISSKQEGKYVHYSLIKDLPLKSQ